MCHGKYNDSVAAISLCPMKLYVDPLSQPSRAVCLFCELNGIPYQSQIVRLFEGENRSPEFKGPARSGRVASSRNLILRFLLRCFSVLPLAWPPLSRLLLGFRCSSLFHHQRSIPCSKVSRAPVVPLISWRFGCLSRFCFA
jgi:hypothetical protein